MDYLDLKARMQSLNSIQFKSIGQILGYSDESSTKYGMRFIRGILGKLEKGSFDDTINFIDMNKVLKVLDFINLQ